MMRAETLCAQLSQKVVGPPSTCRTAPLQPSEPPPLCGPRGLCAWLLARRPAPCAPARCGPPCPSARPRCSLWPCVPAKQKTHTKRTAHYSHAPRGHKTSVAIICKGKSRSYIAAASHSHSFPSVPARRQKRCSTAFSQTRCPSYSRFVVVAALVDFTLQIIPGSAQYLHILSHHEIPGITIHCMSFSSFRPRLNPTLLP